jgi:hypothetical protein
MQERGGLGVNERTDEQPDASAVEAAPLQPPPWEPTPFVRDHGSLFSDQVRRP